jgi:hypothetical protein
MGGPVQAGHPRDVLLSRDSFQMSLLFHSLESAMGGPSQLPRHLQIMLPLVLM